MRAGFLFCVASAIPDRLYDDFFFVELIKNQIDSNNDNSYFFITSFSTEIWINADLLQGFNKKQIQFFTESC